MSSEKEKIPAPNADWRIGSRNRLTTALVAMHLPLELAVAVDSFCAPVGVDGVGDDVGGLRRQVNRLSAIHISLGTFCCQSIHFVRTNRDGIEAHLRESRVIDAIRGKQWRRHHEILLQPPCDSVHTFRQ